MKPAEVLLLLVIGGGAFYLYKTGRLDSILHPAEKLEPSVVAPVAVVAPDGSYRLDDGTTRTPGPGSRTAQGGVGELSGPWWM